RNLGAAGQCKAGAAAATLGECVVQRGAVARLDRIVEQRRDEVVRQLGGRVDLLSVDDLLHGRVAARGPKVRRRRTSGRLRRRAGGRCGEQVDEVDACKPGLSRDPGGAGLVAWPAGDVWWIEGNLTK